MSASDVSRYVEKVCAAEVEEHAEHMRELIAGRQHTRTDLLRWDQDAEASEESISLGAAPLSTRALAAVQSDYDEDDPSARPMGNEGDTRIDTEPPREPPSGVKPGYQVPKPLIGKNAPAPAPAQLKSTQDYPAPTLRRPAVPSEPPTTAPTMEGRAQRKAGPGDRATPRPGNPDPASQASKASAPTVLEMEAPVLPPGYPQQGPPPGYVQTPQPGYSPTPHPGPPYMQTPHPMGGPMPTPQPGGHPLAIYDTPMPVGPPYGNPTWDEDSAELLRQGVSRNRPGLATPAPGPYPQGMDNRGVPPRVLVAAFLVAMAIGFTVTLIIGKLAG